MPLNNHSCYSFRYGIMKPKELLRNAVAGEYPYIALTDINNTSGCLNFMRLAAKKDIRPVIGVDFRNGIDQLYITLAKNNEGFWEINQYLSGFLNQEDNDFPIHPPKFDNVFVIYPLTKCPKRELYNHEFIG